MYSDGSLNEWEIWSSLQARGTASIRKGTLPPGSRPGEATHGVGTVILSDLPRHASGSLARTPILKRHTSRTVLHVESAGYSRQCSIQHTWGQAKEGASAFAQSQQFYISSVQAGHESVSLYLRDTCRSPNSTRFGHLVQSMQAAWCRME